VASFIRPNRTEVNRTFPWLGFTIRTAAAPAWFEVAIATDPSLFNGEAKSRRTPETFYSTRAAGALPAPSGEAVWIVPPAVLARFAGSPKIYYALATFRSADRQAPEIVRVPAAAAPSVALSKSFTGVTRRLAGVGGRSSDAGPDYGSAASPPSLEWAGDTALATPAHPEPEPAAPAAAPAHASALDFTYSDGLGPLPLDSHEERRHHRYPSEAPAAVQPFAFDSPPVTRTTETAGDISMTLESWDGMKYPPGVAGGSTAPSPKRITLEGPRYSAFGVDDIYGNVDVDFQYDGRGVGKVAMRMGAHSDAVTKGLNVTAHIVDDARTFQGPSGQTFGGIRITIDYAMTQVVADDVQAHIDVMLYGSGDYDVRYTAVQGSFDHLPSDVVSGVRPATTTPARAQAIALGTFDSPPVTHSTETSGDLTMNLEAWDGMKYPPGVAGGAGAPSAKRFVVEGPRYAAFGLDNIYANIDVDFQYDGRGVGKVAMRTGEHSDAVTKGLNVTAHIVDDARTFQGPSGQTFGGIRITVDYAMTQVVADDVQAQIDVMLYGSGDYDVRYHVVQGSFDHMPSDVISGVRTASTPARAEAVAMEGEGAAAGAAGNVVGSIAGVVVQRIVENVGDLTIAHESWNGMKYPPGVPRGTTTPNPKQITIEGPRYNAFYVDGIYCDLTVDFEYDGRGVGKVATRAGARSDAVGKGLVVNAHIVDDARTFTGGSGGTQTFAGIRITLEYSFTQVVADDIVVHAQAMLYGNGDYDLEYHLIQGDVDHMPANVSSGVRATSAPGVPQPASLGTAGDIASSAAQRIAGYYVDRLLDDSDNIETSLDQWPHGSDRAGPAAKKFPWDDPSRGGTEAMSHRTMTVAGPTKDLHWIDDMYCELEFSWDYNGHWLTNVDVVRGRRNGPGVSGGTLHVHAHVDDVPGAFTHGTDGPFAALRYNISWEYHRVLHDDIVVHATVTLYGDGTWNVEYHVLQGSVDGLPFPVVSPVVSLPQPSQPQSLEAASAPPVTRSSETRGAVRFELDQYQGMMQPPGYAVETRPTQTATVAIGGPRASALPGLDETYGDCEIAYEYDGRRAGNVHVRPTGAAGTAPLVVVESIAEDPRAFGMPGSPDPLAALKLMFEYRFDSTSSTSTEVVLYGNGRQDIHYHWSQV
jgi:hypothetical protein